MHRTVTARRDDDPKHVLRTVGGWEMFKSYLQVHHTSEDDMLWPPMREALADDSDGVALFDAMEAEPCASRRAWPRCSFETPPTAVTSVRAPARMRS